MKRSVTTALAMVLALACTVPAEAMQRRQQTPAMTPMQIQAMQQKEFEAEKQYVFSSIIDVYQDLGYIITAADLVTGFITAESITSNNTGIMEALAGASGSGNTRTTAYVEVFPSGRVRVRLNFVSTRTLSAQYGQTVRQDTAIMDAAVYQRAFEKIDEALFVRRAVNAPAPPPAAPANAAPANAASASPAT